jgi:hypothetical protein
MSTADISSLKTCFKCGQQQPRTEFYKHPEMGDGLLGKCKSCTKADVSKHRLENIDKIRQYDKDRSLLPHRRKLANEISSKWRRADRRRMKSHNAVARAIKSGLLDRKPCLVCGAAKSEAHHESYDRPIDVTWLCTIHHKARHKQMAIDGIEP